ncbi:hypothetical protein CPB83DRAFT_821288 [Crepidotus variabilis]|uniref:Uncharacterized protein n=1 Tax=Crepidotus variabilis TaxID=179855 RepID=A0A9P6E6X6_9AGAR|nr:hypothetical protein CPB83DRAFT_821288 [Crepidotus variabilis]
MLSFQQVSTPVQLLWSRISFSRLTLIYFAFSVAHCIIQVGIQSRAFSINVKAHKDLTDIVTTAQTFNGSVPYLKDSHLHLCSWIPSDLNTDVASCPIVWSDEPNGGALNNTATDLGRNTTNSAPPSGPTTTIARSSASSTAASTTSRVSSASRSSSTLTMQTSSTAGPRTITVLVIPQTTAVVTSKGDDDDEHDDEDEDDLEDYNDHRGNVRRDLQVTPLSTGGSISVTVAGLKGQGDVVLDEQCLWSLNWPRSVLHNTEREDIVFIAFQFWVLGMSVIALVHESIPHIIASLMTHMMATAWGGFQIVHTANFRSTLGRVITNGACKGAVVLPGYWEARATAEIASLVFNGLALIVSGILTWKLMKSFGWQTFKRVGASLTINRIYKLVLLLSITIQLSLFFMAVTVGLWVDQLMNSMIGDKTLYVNLYKASSFVTLVLLLPWFISGWIGVRKELKLPMFIFLLLSSLYLGGWSVMFFSTTFRWTFVTWQFFSIMASASIFMTLLSVILGVICRYNFGKGLSRYLNGAEILADEHSTPYPSSGDDVEKVAFPSTNGPLPTFTAFDSRGSSFAASAESGRTLGPRFSNKDAEPFDFQGDFTHSQPTAKRNSNTSSLFSTEKYDKPPTQVGMGAVPPSYHSRSNSGNSNHTTSSQGSPKQRWIIE